MEHAPAEVAWPGYMAEAEQMNMWMPYGGHMDPMAYMNMPMPMPMTMPMEYMPQLYPPEMMPRPAEPITSAAAMDYVLGQFPCVRMRGIPYEASMKDVLAFFRDDGLSPFIVDVVMPVTSDGRAIGDACVLFSGLMEAQAALQKDRQLMGRRYIEIFLAPRDVYYKTVRKMILAATGVDNQAAAGKKSTRRNRQAPSEASGTSVSQEEVDAVLEDLEKNQEASGVLVDTMEKLEDMLRDLRDAKEVAMDCEGVNLSRHGSLSLVQLYKRPLQTEEGAANDTPMAVYLVDVTVLGEDALSHEVTEEDGADKCAISLKKILESDDVLKIIFDPRSDADALHHLFGVDLRNVVCVQLTEMAVRKSRGMKVRLLLSMARVLEEHANLGAADRRNFQVLKSAGKKLISTGDSTVWDERPLKPELLHYATFDVRHLFGVFDKMWSTLSEEMKGKVLAESNVRARFYENAEYDPSDRRMAEAPEL